MLKHAIAVVTLSFLSLSSLAGSDPKYPASAIPESLKTGMYAVVRESSSRFYIESQNRCSHYVRSVTTILNPNGKSYASIAIYYDKLTRIESIKANVYDAAGNLVRKLKQSDLIDQSAVSGGSLYEDNRVKHADLAQSSYPYTVEVEYVVSQKFYYSVPDFYLYQDDEVSTEKAEYVLIYPAPLKPRYKLFNIGEPTVGTESDKRESLTWTFSQVKPKKFERLAPSSDHFVPNVKAAPSLFKYEEYAGDMSTWKSYGEWMVALNAGRDVLPAPTKEKIRQLTNNCKTTEEKARVVYEYVQNKTRYVSIQLGIGGLQPFDATVVDQTGYGDCKALSNYTVALLKEVGVKAYYTVIMAGPEARNVDSQFPSHQANHVIVGVPNNRDTIWLECTNQTNPFGYIGTFTGDRLGLMITDEGGKLVRTTVYPAEQNLQSRIADVFIEMSGDARAEVHTKYSGLKYEEGGLHFRLDAKYDEQKKWLQNNTGIPSFDIAKFSMQDHKDRIPSADVNIELNLRRFATVSGKRLFLMPNLMNRSTFVPEKLEKRETNIVWREPFIEYDTIRYHLPEGIYPEFIPEPIKVSSRFGEYEAGFALDQDKLVYTRRLKLVDGEYPANTYGELTDFYRNINKADNIKMVFLNKT
jgi:hypothetical protein